MLRGNLVGVQLTGHEEEIVSGTVEQDGNVEHPHAAARVANGKQCVANCPANQTDDDDIANAEVAEDGWHQQHHHHFGPLRQGHDARGVFHLDLIQVCVGEGVVEGERDAGENGSHSEEEVGLVLHDDERVEPQNGPDADRRTLTLRRHVGQHRQTDDHHHDGRCGGGPELVYRRLPLLIANQKVDENPAERAHEPNQREFLARVLYQLEAYGIGECHGREVAEAEGQHDGVDFRERCGLRHQEHKDGAEAVEHRHHSFRGEKPIRHQANEERRDHGRDGHRPENSSGLSAGEMKRRRHVGADRDVPGTPHDVVDEHHDPQPKLATPRQYYQDSQTDDQRKERPDIEIGH